jgi:hypothetical protein
VDLVAAVGADEQSAAVVEPGEGALDHPALLPEPRSVRSLAAGDQRLDPSRSDLTAVPFGVIAAIGKQAFGSLPWSSGAAPDLRDEIDQRNELGDVVSVAGGERPGQRETASVYEQVVLGTSASTIDGAGTCFRAPFLACRWLESQIARDQSMSPPAFSSESRSACSRSKTPSSCQACRRRQQVMPQPKPSSFGRCSQPMPV